MLKRPLPLSTLSASLSLIALATLLSGCGEASTAAPARAATEVGVITIATQSLAISTELPGRTLAVQTAEIRPQVSGIVRARLFTEGSTVKAGQALYQIDPASYQATVMSAQAGVARAEATVQAAELKAKRQKELLDADAGARQDHEDAQAALLQARADLKTAQATLATAQIDLARTRISAPIGGRVDTSSVTAGALVTANQTAALTTVQQLDPMWVDIPQSSVELLKLRQQLASGALKKNGELSIRLVLEDGSAYAHAGRLQVSGVTVNTTTGAVTLRAQVPNPDGLLLPGMYVRAQLDQAVDPAAVLVPQAGIARNSHGDAVAMLVGKDGKVEQRKVTVAEVVQGQWRVTAGLRAGERLIVEGTGKVMPGQLVQAVPAAAKSATTAATVATN